MVLAIRKRKGCWWHITLFTWKFRVWKSLLFFPPLTSPDTIQEFRKLVEKLNQQYKTPTLWHITCVPAKFSGPDLSSAPEEGELLLTIVVNGFCFNLGLLSKPANLHIVSFVYS